MADAAYVGSRPGWYQGWTILVVCALAGVAGNALTVNAFSLFLRSWSADLGVPISTVTLGLSLGGLGCAIGAPFVGALVDRLPARRIYVAGLISIVAFGLLLSQVRHAWQFILTYALMMPLVLTLPTTLAGNAVATRWFVRKRGLALAIISMGMALGGIIMPPIIGLVMPTIGWRNVWLGQSVIVGLILLPVLLLTFRERPDARDGTYYLEAEAGSAGHGLHGGAPGRAGGLKVRHIVGSRVFWLLIVTFIPMLAAYGGCQQNIGPIAASRGLDEHAAGALLAVLGAGQLAATLACGLLSDRFGNRVPLVGLALSTALGVLLVAVSGNVVLLGLGALLAGCGGAFWPAVAAALAREFGTGGMGRAFGLLSLSIPLTGLAPFLVAKITEGSGTYLPALVTLAALAAAGGVACLLLLRERRADTPPAGAFGSEMPVPAE